MFEHRYQKFVAIFAKMVIVKIDGPPIVSSRALAVFAQVRKRIQKFLRHIFRRFILSLPDKSMTLSVICFGDGYVGL
ncbi:hypothetical protein AK51_30065 [Serratia nematodiphila DZ0503SBS1]|nr:hypothetical protein AK51_30065 [Serratia nematodiphila DZ0503SBS1]